MQGENRNKAMLSPSAIPNLGNKFHKESIVTILKKPQLGTDPSDGWHFYSLHMASSYLIREYLLVSNYSKCIQLSVKHGDHIEKIHMQYEKLIGEKPPYSEQIILNAKELSSWAVSMEGENYHNLYVHSFIGMWSSFEAGIENFISDLIQNDYSVAKLIPQLLKKCKYRIEDWPWEKAVCLELAQKLEPKAKREAEDGGVDLFERLKKLFQYLDIHIELGDEDKYSLAEANRMRNILLHRYGEITEKDCQDFPRLSEWQGQVMPFDKDLFHCYYRSINSTLVSLMKAIRIKKSANGT